MEITNTAELSGISVFDACTTIFYDPSKAFATLEQRRLTWLAVGIMIVTSCVLMAWYFRVVDITWLAEQMTSDIQGAAERAKSSKLMTRSSLQAMMLGGTLVGIPLVLGTTAAMLLIAAKFMNKPLSFGACFSLAAWSATPPTVLLLVLGGMQILMNPNGQMDFSELNPLSLNQLFFHYGMDHPLASLFDSLSVTMIWNALLLVIGFQMWAKVSRSVAVKVVAIPYLAFYAIWTAIAMSRIA